MLRRIFAALALTGVLAASAGCYVEARPNTVRARYRTAAVCPAGYWYDGQFCRLRRY